MVGGHPYGIDGDMWQGWEHVGACGRVWGYVVGVVACGKGGDMWQGVRPMA